MRSLLRDPDEAALSSDGDGSRTVHARVDKRDGVVVVTPVGPLPDPLPEMLAEQLERLIADWPVIVDLSGTVVVSAAPLVGLTGWVLGTSQPDQCCVVCARPSARALLRRWHITRCLAVFGSIGDALQARRYAHEGYGTGWWPGAPGAARPDPLVVHSRGLVPAHPDREHQPA